MTTHPYQEISDLSQLPAPDETGIVSHYVFQYLDFFKVPQYLAAGHRYSDCCFLGCEIPSEMEGNIGRTCLIFPRMGRSYNVFRSRLYTGEDLYEGYEPGNEDTFETCFDSRVYADYKEKGQQCGDVRETALNRSDVGYRNVAYISKKLTEKGKLMASGGGPGAMEATHFGAWMAGRSDEDFEDALAILSVAETFRDEGWLRSAFEVRAKYPQSKYRSLGIPTWFYGHEPATPFATDIAKYFYNSVREDTLLSIAKGGIIYSPGSAGTIQEIFQDAAQNHYETFGAPSPMVFLGKDFFTREIPIYPLLEDLLARDKYKNLMISVTDDPEEAIDTLLSFSGMGPKEEC